MEVAKPKDAIHDHICEFHDQADTKWIVIGGPLWGYNNMPSWRPTSGCPIVSLGVIRPQYFSLLLISNIIFKHCPPDHGINQFPMPLKPTGKQMYILPFSLVEGIMTILEDPQIKV
jgi:hypothetical protein